MKPEMFLADIERKPEALEALALSLGRENPWFSSSVDRGSHLVLLGMGSSHYANGVAAARLRAAGVNAVAEIASSDLLPEVQPATIVVAVSASGGSVETLDAVSRYEGRCPIIAMTNVEGSKVTSQASIVLPMQAEVEQSGVSCRSFQHTLALYLGLEAHLGIGPDPHLEILRPCTLLHQHRLECHRLGRSGAELGEVVADQRADGGADFNRRRGIAARAFLDHAFQHRGREGDAGRLERLQVHG